MGLTLTLSPRRRARCRPDRLWQNGGPCVARGQGNGPLGLADAEAPRKVAQQLGRALRLVLVDRMARLCIQTGHCCTRISNYWPHMWNAC